jgi:hypothetical protein
MCAVRVHPAHRLSFLLLSVQVWLLMALMLQFFFAHVLSVLEGSLMLGFRFIRCVGGEMLVRLCLRASQP